MASRFLVVVALFAVCHSSPLNDDVIYRNQRSFTVAEGSSISGNGPNEASAIVEGYNAKAYSRNNIARDALDQNGPAGQAYAKAGHYDSPNTDGAIGIAKSQAAYYPVPAPATVVAYQQYDAPAEIHPYVIHQGHGSASSLAQVNGIAAPIDYEPSVIAAKNYGYNAGYNPAHNSAISTASVHGQGSATSSAKTGPASKSISWRFGTAYDNPAGSAKSAASSFRYSNVPSLNAAAQSQGTGAAQSTANNYGASSAVNTRGGAANANAAINDQGYAHYLRTGEHFGAGAVQSHANSNGFSSANSNADLGLDGYGIAKANANSHEHGSAQSSANTNGGYGLRSAGWGGNTGANAQAHGFGDATSSAKNSANGYRVANSAANSYGPGSARSAAQSV